jgi:hypothetical protein
LIRYRTAARQNFAGRTPYDLDEMTARVLTFAWHDEQALARRFLVKQPGEAELNLLGSANCSTDKV